MRYILTVSSPLFGQKPIIGHCPGTALVDTIAGMANVQNPDNQGTAMPALTIQLRRYLRWATTWTTIT